MCGINGIFLKDRGSRVDEADMVDHDVTGFIEKPDAIEGFAMRLEALLQSPELREEMGTNSRERAIRDFSLSSTASRASAAYRLALSKDSCDS